MARQQQRRNRVARDTSHTPGPALTPQMLIILSEAPLIVGWRRRGERKCRAFSSRAILHEGVFGRLSSWLWHLRGRGGTGRLFAASARTNPPQRVGSVHPPSTSLSRPPGPREESR
jgi:hypothetical protein